MKRIPFLKTAAAYLCIVYVLYIVLSTQLAFSVPYVPDDGTRPAVHQINTHISNFNWAMSTSGWLLGMTTTWRMFSPVDRQNWYLRTTLTYEDGGTSELPNPLTTDRSLLQRNLFDYREAKFQLNSYARDEIYQMYGDYLCRQHSADGRNVEEVEFSLDSVSIKPPAPGSSMVTKFMDITPAGLRVSHEKSIHSIS
ncbi:MAG: hypothetical protein TR69_WS6001001553 [candidate division WS6 bacterium OLB20]|uniref:Uncharacterized protein n=1 Tax=candidate division WS6 bacterium OLB20 TaxID=1617426 RepID=A0A136LVS2_9BACT|nr:MAG: hypothetical protein TR69_WS6001001553 [candidate division WS6 bacterium OLB20]